MLLDRPSDNTAKIHVMLFDNVLAALGSLVSKLPPHASADHPTTVILSHFGLLADILSWVGG